MNLTAGASGSLFGNNNQSNAFNRSERTLDGPGAVNASSLLQTGLNSSTGFGALGEASQQDIAAQRLGSANLYNKPNEKNVLSQIQTLLRKWDPNSQDTLIQAYIYNSVNSAYAPFYYRNADEPEKEWEEALAKKPKPIESNDGNNRSFVPVLVRGFHALGSRLEYQARIVTEMRARLHEMNNSLDAVMKRHQQSIMPRIENANRQHMALSQRALRLAVKVQVLRNRGFALDQAEEGLRKTLLALEKQVLDQSFVAREEEIWARMLALRERSRWLEEEGKRLGGHRPTGEEGEDAGGAVPQHVLAKAKRILADYDEQLVHLRKELVSLNAEVREFQGAQTR